MEPYSPWFGPIGIVPASKMQFGAFLSDFRRSFPVGWSAQLFCEGNWNN
jgi:hypothetical protein